MFRYLHELLYNKIMIKNQEKHGQVEYDCSGLEIKIILYDAKTTPNKVNMGLF